MFDDVLGMLRYCTDEFCNSVRDKFGASIVADVLEPIQNEISSLGAFNEEFQQNATKVNQVLQEAQSLQMGGGSSL